MQEPIADLDAARLFPGTVVTAISEADAFREAAAEDQGHLQRYPDGHTFSRSPS